MCLIHQMFQFDLFIPASRPGPVTIAEAPLDSLAIMERLREHCERPRYSFMVLNLIAQETARSGAAGPDVAMDGGKVPVREWLAAVVAPIAQRPSTRLEIAGRVERELAARNELPADPARAESLVETLVQKRVKASALTNISRAVTELVKAGLVQRHYQGYRVDHVNRGAQRNAVYTVTPATMRALGVYP